jgi:hypothetical protein
VGPAALDLANWLHGSPWVPPSSDPASDLEQYVAARTSEVDELGFVRAVDAAAVLLFLLLDLPGIASGEVKDASDIVSPCQDGAPSCGLATTGSGVVRGGPGSHILPGEPWVSAVLTAPSARFIPAPSIGVVTSDGAAPPAQVIAAG